MNFAIYTAIVLAVYYLLEQRARNVWLLLASYVFYATWSPAFAGVLLAMTLLNFFVAQRISASAQHGRRWLWVGNAFNLLPFIFLKLESSSYSVFLEKLVSWLTGSAPLSLHVLLPVGFSFYILQAVSYLIDVSRKQLPASTNLVDFALYMAYFPRLVSGPIERARRFLPLLAQLRTVDNAAMGRGFTLILVGLIRKILISGQLSVWIPQGIFVTPSKFSPLDLRLGLLIYAFWL